MHITKSEAYVAIHKRIFNLIRDFIANGKISNDRGYYHFISDESEIDHNEFLDQVEDIINSYGESINASPELIDSWLWHFPTLLGSYGYELALAHQIIFNPLLMDLGMLQFLATMQSTIVNDSSTEDAEIAEYYSDCVFMINNMIDTPFDENYFVPNTAFFHGQKKDIKDFSAYYHFISEVALNNMKYLQGGGHSELAFIWIYDSKAYQLDSFDRNNELFIELFEYFCDNEQLCSCMNAFVESYCKGALNVGNLQTMMQYLMLMEISEYLLSKGGRLKGFGIGTLSLIFKLITHSCVVRSEGLGVSSQIKLILIDPVTLHDQENKQIVQYYAGVLKYYKSNVVGDLDKDQAFYILQYFDLISDRYIGNENLVPLPKQSIQAKMKDIMVALKNMDRDQKTLVNRSYCQV